MVGAWGGTRRLGVSECELNRSPRPGKALAHTKVAAARLCARAEGDRAGERRSQAPLARLDGAQAGEVGGFLLGRRA